MSKKLEKSLSKTLTALKNSITLCATLESREGLPAVFEKIPAWLGLVQRTLECAQSEVQAGNLDDDDDDVVNGLKTSRKHAETLEGIIKTVCTASETPLADRYEAAVKEHGREDIVAATLQSLMKTVNGLVEDDEITPSEEDAADLRKALTEISKMVSKPEGSDAKFSHTGEGDMINNMDQATLYLNKGGKQYNAKSMRLGK